MARPTPVTHRRSRTEQQQSSSLDEASQRSSACPSSASSSRLPLLVFLVSLPFWSAHCLTRTQTEANLLSRISAKIMGIGPAFAIPKALEKAGITQEEVDFFEMWVCIAALDRVDNRLTRVISQQRGIRIAGRIFCREAQDPHGQGQPERRSYCVRPPARCDWSQADCDCIQPLQADRRQGLCHEHVVSLGRAWLASV